jgi:hypothetical protein
MGSFLEDGYTTVKSRNTINSLKTVVLPLLPAGYVFLDYRYDVIGPALFTYHRDVTSSRACFGAAHPIYTVIHYNYSGDLLSVSPGSHISYKMCLPVTVRGERNTAIIIDCDLVHGGMNAPDCIERRITQYKVVHKDDLHLLSAINGQHVSKKGHNVSPYLRPFIRLGSYIFVVPIQSLFLSVIQKHSVNGLELLLKLFSIF